MTELNDFLQQAANKPGIYAATKKDFVRRRTSTIDVLFIFIISLLKNSLQTELNIFFRTNLLNKQSPSKSAFCQARKKLNVLFFEHFFEKTVSIFYNHNPKVKRYKGYRLCSKQGTKTKTTSLQ